MALKKFKLVNLPEGTKKLVTREGVYVIEKLTDEQADKLLARGCRYIAKIEAGDAAAPKEKKGKGEL